MVLMLWNVAVIEIVARGSLLEIESEKVDFNCRDGKDIS
jgi:hypothetical protein